MKTKPVLAGLDEIRILDRKPYPDGRLAAGGLGGADHVGDAQIASFGRGGPMQTARRRTNVERNRIRGRVDGNGLDS